MSDKALINAFISGSHLRSLDEEGEVREYITALREQQQRLVDAWHKMQALSASVMSWLSC